MKVHWLLNFSGGEFCSVGRKSIRSTIKGSLPGPISPILLYDKIILELKSVRQLSSCMEAQLINYLRLSKVPVGYLVNFRNTKVEWRRFIVTGE
jgi:GxxExxY protein